MLIKGFDYYDHTKTYNININDCKLWLFNNKEKTAIYNAREYTTNGEPLDHWVTVIVYGWKVAIKDILNSPAGNAIMVIYARKVNYNSRWNDPNGELKEKFINYVIKNKHLFFNKFGDIRKRKLPTEINWDNI